jgi:hypothetical protein
MEPKVVIRFGSHAEKEYLLKTLKFLDGLIIGANLIEATPAATASLIVKAGGKKLSTPYYIDPMTYAFGTYTQRETGRVRADLDWIKSDQKIPGTKRMKRDFKSSYRQLAETFGGLFDAAVKAGRAVAPRDFATDKIVTDTCRSVVNYQLTRIPAEFKKDPEFGEYADDMPAPAAVFAPYFYIEPRDSDAWIDVNLKLATATVRVSPEVPVHGILCVDRSYLLDARFIELIKQALPETGVSAVWLWFSCLQEDAASLEELTAFRQLVESLSGKMDVFNLHGGFFSLALANVGLSGISHGIGYGEQKDVIPVIGQSIPTVRYYLPDIYKRVGVGEVERCFDALDIKQPSDFHEQICSCIVCKGVVSQNVTEFSEFGEIHRSRPVAKRPAQTPAAAKRCRFHFVLNRIRERDEQKTRTLAQTREGMQQALAKWAAQPSMAGHTKHLERWIAALKAQQHRRA